MKIRKFYVLTALLVWCVSCGAAFFAGRASLDKPSSPQAAAREPAAQPGTASSNDDHSAASGFNLQGVLDGTVRADNDAIEEWAASIDPSEMAGLIEELQKMPAGEQRDDLIEELVDSWSGRDPKGFLAARDKITNPRTREDGVVDALQSLAQADPKAAMAWLADSTDAVPNQLLARRYRETIEGIAEQDPAAALDLVKQMASTSAVDRQIRQQSLNALVDTLVEDGNYTDALQVFSTLSPEDRAAASARAVRSWADESPTTASAYVATVEDAAMRAQMAGQVAQRWARNDPQAAAAWAMNFEQANAQNGGEPSGQILAEAIRTWSFFDLNGPAEFLNKMPKGASADQAITAFTMQARNIDPASAMNWANNITDPAARQRVTSAVALQWLATDPAGFNQNAANMNSFTDQQKQFMNFLSQNPEALNRINQRINTEGLDSLRGFGGGGRGQGNPNPPAAAPAR